MLVLLGVRALFSRPIVVVVVVSVLGSKRHVEPPNCCFVIPPRKCGEEDSYGCYSLIIGGVEPVNSVTWDLR